MQDNDDYDNNNVIAKIIRGELASKIRYEDDEVLVIDDINPHAPTHVLVIPKGQYINFQHFVNNAEDVANFFKKIGKIAELLKIEENGYRLITNIGKDGGQTIPHFHVHLLAGKRFSNL